MEIIGELEAQILSVLKEKREATAAEVHLELSKRREIAYTTISTTLDRLYRKKLVERRSLPGPGGTRYLFLLGKDEGAKSHLIDAALDRLTEAFGETAYSALYKKLETLPDGELAKLRKQVDSARRASRRTG